MKGRDQLIVTADTERFSKSFEYTKTYDVGARSSKEIDAF